MNSAGTGGCSTGATSSGSLALAIGDVTGISDVSVSTLVVGSANGVGSVSIVANGVLVVGSTASVLTGTSGGGTSLPKTISSTLKASARNFSADGVGHRYSANRSYPLIRLPANGAYGKLGVEHEDTMKRKWEPVGSRGSGNVLNGMA
jgi:hypothetical protein